MGTRVLRRFDGALILPGGARATEGGKGREQRREARRLLKLKLGTTVLDGLLNTVLIFRKRKHQQNPFYFEII